MQGFRPFTAAHPTVDARFADIGVTLQNRVGPKGRLSGTKRAFAAAAPTLAYL